ncbi:MAG TPA: hypothetical protein VE913_23945, partial [Longimicrobium sp.]|nr:hypothetical protein [Longimicrobium sp.]
MEKRIGTFIIRDSDSVRLANQLAIGPALRLVETEGGVPELTGPLAEVEIYPSGGDDGPAITAALARYPRVRLAPGTFQLAAAIVVPAGRRVAGSGVANTEVVCAGMAMILSADAEVEALTLTGPGPSPFGASIAYGLRAGGGSTRIADVRVRGFEMRGVWLLNPGRAIVERVSVEGAGIGIDAHSGSAFAGQVEIRNVSFTGCGTGMRLRGVHGTVAGAVVQLCNAGIVTFAS